MPTRLIRDGIVTSDRIDRLTPAAEVCYIRLLLVADDYGRHDGRPAILRARMYPLRLDRVTDADVSGWLDECERAGLVRRYTVGGRPYIEIPRFDQRIRAKVSRCPPPDGSQADDGHVTDTCPADDGQMTGACRLEAQSETKAETKAKSVESTEPGEPASVPTETPEPIVMTYPVVGPGPAEWPLLASKAREWEETYPALDVASELKKARQWVIDRPERRKTARGMIRFLAGWLQRTNDSPRPPASGHPPTAQTSKNPAVELIRRRQAEAAAAAAAAEKGGG